jgi:hypothetical protein
VARPDHDLRLSHRETRYPTALGRPSQRDGGNLAFRRRHRRRRLAG